MQQKKPDIVIKVKDTLTLKYFINFEFQNYMKQKQNIVYCQMTCNFKNQQCTKHVSNIISTKTTTTTKTKTKETHQNKKTTSTILTHYRTHLIYALPQLCLIVILLLSLLTVQHANCQQQQQQQILPLPLTTSAYITTPIMHRNSNQSQWLFINNQNYINNINSYSKLNTNTIKFKHLSNIIYHVQKKPNIIARNKNNYPNYNQKSVPIEKTMNGNSQQPNQQRNVTNVANISKHNDIGGAILAKDASAESSSENSDASNLNMYIYNKKYIDNHLNSHGSKLIKSAHSLIILNQPININTSHSNYNDIDNRNETKAVNSKTTVTSKTGVFDINVIKDKAVAMLFHNQHVVDNDVRDDHLPVVIDNDVRLQPNRFTDSEDNQKLMRLVMDGLGLQTLPDMTKVNISQQEYATKYNEYLRRVHERRREVADQTYNEINSKEGYTDTVSLHILSIVTNASATHIPQRQHKRLKRNAITTNKNLSTNQKRIGIAGSRHKSRHHNEKTNILLHFPLNVHATQLQSEDLEEANIRLMLIHSPALASKTNNKNEKPKQKQCDSNTGKQFSTQKTLNNKKLEKHVLNLKVYQRLPRNKRVWLDGKKIEISIDSSSKVDDTQSQWLQFDVTKAVEIWLRQKQENLGLEVQCDNCQRIGARILNDVSADSASIIPDADDAKNQLMPVLNIIGRLGITHREFQKRNHSDSSSDKHWVSKNNNSDPSRSSYCFKANNNERCCRHSMEVIFKEIKGFEFIIQPKVFDAGYCHGRCPPRYNPAHHHAMLQSLIWKQDRSRAPRPCCAPSKLVELEVLHVDETDSEKLKISTWTDMRVIDCACS